MWEDIEVLENQKVIDSGLYGIVRHPMYLATTLLFMTMPIILASPLSFLVMLGYLPVIAKRIRNEERVLLQGLKGYDKYLQKVKYKIIPFVVGSSAGVVRAIERSPARVRQKSAGHV